jgi:hypothetical protein
LILTPIFQRLRISVLALLLGCSEECEQINCYYFQLCMIRKQGGRLFWTLLRLCFGIQFDQYTVQFYPRKLLKNLRINLKIGRIFIQGS